MPLTLVDNNSIARLEVGGRNSASADVLLHGATLIRWKARGQERMFLSSKAPLDGSAAIRGGIPLVFPVFGSPKDHPDNHGLEKLPKHGLVRTVPWKLRQGTQVDHATSQGNQAVTASFSLSSSDIPDAAAVYQWPFELIYDVTLAKDSLTTALHITHPSSQSQLPPMRFQALLHNYLRVPSALTASVRGLQGQSFKDKTDGGKEKSLGEQPQGIVLDGRPSDAVFMGPAPPSVDLTYAANGAGIRLVRSPNLPNTVVWNPAEEGAEGIADLHKGGWKEYICVEPGSVVGFQELEAGKTFTASQTLQVQ